MEGGLWISLLRRAKGAKRAVKGEDVCWQPVSDHSE